MLICPNCKNKTLQTYKTNSLEAKGVGVILRYRKCTQCGCNYQTIEKIKEVNNGTEENKEKTEHDS